MRVGILGAAEARNDGSPVDLGTRKQRALLAALALHRGRAVPPDTLVDLLWGETPPAAVTATLQGYVAGLRRALEPDRAPRAPAEVLVTEQTGYALHLPEGALDAAEFETTVARVHQQLGTWSLLEAPPSADLAAHVADLNAALGLWRGLPYTELEDAPAAQSERGRLEEWRAVALEDRAVASLGLGRHQVVAGELEVLTATYPLRERLWGLRALALTRSGRQADALEVLRQVRDLLDEELGLEPGAELRALQTAVLRQDPALDWASHPPPTVHVSSRPAVRPGEPAWPLVGRDDQLAALVGLLERSAEHPEFAVVTGDPGIGKSRLCAELGAAARADGVQILVGRCSQDQGAPPLYPWASVLRGLGRELPSGAEGSDGTARFRAWEEIAGAVVAAAQERHLLVMLDDLHWADTSTLRVLRLIAETAEAGRLMVVSTWRHEPPPTGHLAEVAETLARRHALRLQLTGLSAEEAGEVVSTVGETTPTASEAGALRERTDGNPFFLVEYARLARERGDLSALLGEEHPPAAVQDVLTRRMAALPEEVSGALHVACVVGRHFDVPTLARLLDVDEDTVLDRLDVALRAGLLREYGVDRFRFAHALVRDTAYASLSQSRRGRMHARAAQVLAGVPGRESEVARHWLAAGPQHAAEAWRAAGDAAEAARRVFAYDEAVELRRAALEAAQHDQLAGPADRYDLLLGLAEALQLAGNWVEARAVVREALHVSADLDDVDRTLRGAALLATNALWQGGGYGVVDDQVVAALRHGLDRLPAGDGPARCRAMVCLATEIYFSASLQEREALCDEALAMVRRLDDPPLRLWVLLSVVLPLWRPGSAARRLEISRESIELARRLGDEVALSTALIQHATSLFELGQLAALPDAVARARHQAAAVRHNFGDLVLDGLEVPLLAMRGEFDRVDGLLAHMTSMHEQLTLEQSADAVTGAVLMRLLWSGQVPELLQMLGGLDDVRVLPPEAPTALLLCRVGRVDEARALLAATRVDLYPHWWFSSFVAAAAAESAAYVGLPDLAAEAYAALVDLRGHSASAGSGTSLGPVDAFLAMAAHATGERDLATEHADDAARLCAEWEIPLAAEWLTRVREHFGF